MKKRISLFVLAFALIAFAISCKKSSDNSGTDANKVFVGNYYGTLVTGGTYTDADTMVITASGSSGIVMNSKTGRGSTYSITGNVSGNSITISSQSVYVASYGYSFTVSGSGTLSGTNLQVNMTFVSPTSVSTGLVFSGTKQ